MTIPDGYGQATYGFTGVNLPTGANVVVGFQNSGAQTAQACADDAIVAWYNNIRPQQVDDITLASCLVKLGPDDVGPSALATSTGAGGNAGSAAPPSSALLVRKVTGLGGRRGRGRMYVPGLDESEVDDAGNLNSGILALWQTAFTNYLAAMDAAGVPLRLLHEPPTEWVLVDGQPRRVATGPTPIAPTVITSLVVQNRLATQRRRQRR